jgi:16S rRNA (guanine527-N7)-methyltransferase
MPAAPAPPDDLAPLASGAAALGIALSAEQLAAFATYRALLLEWNARFNLTAITDPAQIVTRHFLDSLTVARGVPRARWVGAPRLLDVGSGAGFPGLALAIAFPHWHVTALEATGKKITFLRHVAAALGLARVRVLEGRAEALAHAPAERARYDVVTARALAALPTLLEYCQPFARAGGVVIAPKKGELAAELEAGRRAAATLGGRLAPPLPITLPGLEGDRVLVVVSQERPCPALYPRPAGAPRKHPLG